MDVDSEELQGRLVFFSPLQDEGIVAPADLAVVEDAIAHLLTEDVLEVPEHELSVDEDLVEVGPESVLGVIFGRNIHLSIEGDDGPEASLLRQDPQLSFRINIHTIFPYALKLSPIDLLQVLFTEPLQGCLADQRPYRLAVVEDLIGLLMLLRNVEVKLDNRDDQFIDNPSDSQREELSSPCYDLLVVLVIVGAVEPLWLKDVHFS